MHDWNGLKYILASARAGGLTGAARALGVNHSTMCRRPNALEQDLGSSSSNGSRPATGERRPSRLASRGTP